MQITILFTNVAPSASLKTYAEEKVRKLEKLLERPLLARVELAVDRHHRHGVVQRAEILLKLPKRVLYATHTGEEMHEAIDLVVEKIEQQVRKYRERTRTQQRQGSLLRRMTTLLWPASQRASQAEAETDAEEQDPSQE